MDILPHRLFIVHVNFMY